MYWGCVIDRLVSFPNSYVEDPAPSASDCAYKQNKKGALESVFIFITIEVRCTKSSLDMTNEAEGPTEAKLRIQHD